MDGVSFSGHCGDVRQAQEEEDSLSGQIAKNMAQLQLAELSSKQKKEEAKAPANTGQPQVPVQVDVAQPQMSEVLVYFDLETTGLNADCEIIQVSAVHSRKTFNAYVLPRCPITPRASRVNNFTVLNGRLCHRGQPVETVMLHEALEGLIRFLATIPADVWLAAHNARAFDKPVLERALTSCSLQDRFRAKVTAFVDTLLLSRKLNPGVEKHSLENLVKQFLGKSYDAHNATEDARILQELCNSWKPSRKDLVACHL